MGATQVCNRRKRSAAGDSQATYPEDSEEALRSGAEWSLKDYLELCVEGEEHHYKHKVRFLPESEAATAATAVDKLNKGILNCPEGFCLVHSVTRGIHGLLWRKGMKGFAFEKLGVEEAELRRAMERRSAQQREQARLKRATQLQS